MLFVTFLLFQDIENRRFLPWKINHVDFARISVWKFNAFLSECLVILHDEWELCLMHHERIVPKLNQIQYFLLNLHVLDLKSAFIKEVKSKSCLNIFLTSIHDMFILTISQFLIFCLTDLKKLFLPRFYWYIPDVKQNTAKYLKILNKSIEKYSCFFLFTLSNNLKTAYWNPLEATALWKLSLQFFTSPSNNCTALRITLLGAVLKTDSSTIIASSRLGKEKKS